MADSTPVTQNHVGQFLTAANERGGQFRGTVLAVTPGGVVMNVYGQTDGEKWITLKRPETRAVAGARIVEGQL